MIKPISFLLVDDDPDDILLFKEVLTQVDASIQLQTATNGKEALKVLRECGDHLPQVIFMDINMPIMNGKESLREIKKDQSLHKIPVIMYTTSSQSSDIEEAMMSGALCYITKPSSLNDLQSILKSISQSIPHALEKTIRQLSNTANTCIVC